MLKVNSVHMKNTWALAHVDTSLLTAPTEARKASTGCIATLNHWPLLSTTENQSVQLDSTMWPLIVRSGQACSPVSLSLLSHHSHNWSQANQHFEWMQSMNPHQFNFCISHILSLQLPCSFVSRQQSLWLGLTSASLSVQLIKTVLHDFHHWSTKWQSSWQNLPNLKVTLWAVL